MEVFTNVEAAIRRSIAINAAVAIENPEPFDVVDEIELDERTQTCVSAGGDVDEEIAISGVWDGRDFELVARKPR